MGQRDRWQLGLPLPHPDAALDMPWIWQVLRDGVYTRLPRHKTDTVLLVLSPVVVGGIPDSSAAVPGVGVAGNF